MMMKMTMKKKIIYVLNVYNFKIKYISINY